MTDQEIEKIIKSNMMLTMNFVGIRQDLEQKLKRKPLTDEAIATIYWGATGQSLRPQDNALAHNFARAIEAEHGIGKNK